MDFARRIWTGVSMFFNRQLEFIYWHFSPAFKCISDASLNLQFKDIIQDFRVCSCNSWHQEFLGFYLKAWPCFKLTLMLCLFFCNIFSFRSCMLIRTLHCKQKTASALKLPSAGYIFLAEVPEVSAKRNLSNFGI